jgi:uncharacterized membrane protein
MIGEPRVVEAGRGAAWWAGGFRLFAARPGKWILIMIVYFLISALIGIVPYVGDVGHWLLTPVFMGGIMIGCDSLERHGELRVAHLFEGFQGTHFVPLMIIGAVNIALVLAIIAITAAGVFGGLKLASIWAMNDPFDAFAGSIRAITGTGFLAILLILVIASVFAMLNWFAPALVVLRGATAVEAMKLSFFACLRNWVPFLVYGAIGIGIAIAIVIAVGVAGIAVGVSAFMSGSGSGATAYVGLFVLLGVLLLILALIAGPIVFGSTYTAYKDTLAADDTALGNPAYH